MVNLTKLQQLDLGWNPEKCSGDLKLVGLTVSKVAEMYGDYSTVLASQGVLGGEIVGNAGERFEAGKRRCGKGRMHSQGMRVCH